PWIVRILAPNKPGFHRASEAIGILAFAGAAYAGYTVLAIGIGRARLTRFNWIVTGGAALVNIALNFALIPPYGMIGAAIPTRAAPGRHPRGGCRRRRNGQRHRRPEGRVLLRRRADGGAEIELPDRGRRRAREVVP